MTYEHRSGDLFAQSDLQAIGHGVNCVGKMGSGIAVEFRNRFPAMHTAYVQHCAEKTLRLGMVFPWVEGNLHVLNIASQHYTGRDARMDALVQGVRKSLHYCEVKEIRSLGLPQIGCGIGGLDWDEVRPVLEDLASQSRTHLVLVSYSR